MNNSNHADQQGYKPVWLYAVKSSRAPQHLVLFISLNVLFLSALASDICIFTNKHWTPYIKLEATNQL